jgi:hypothetical protein
MTQKKLDASTRKRIGSAALGYVSVAIFLGVFIITRHAKDWLGLPADLSEATSLTLAAVVAVPVLLPFVWERLTKLKFGDIEIDLAQVSTSGGLALADELKGVEELAMGPSMLPNLIDKMATAIKEAEVATVAEIDLGGPWWSTRLYLLAALAEDYTDIRLFVFLDSRPDQSRVFVDSATPATLRRVLALHNPKLKEAYDEAVKIPAPESDRDVPEKRIAWIAQNFVWQFTPLGGEEKVKLIVTRDFIKKLLPQSAQSLEWDGGPASQFLLRSILERPERFVPLIRNTGQLNVVVDRLRLVEEIAKFAVRQP